MGDRATMMTTLQKFGQQGGHGQPGANMPPALPPMAGGQMPSSAPIMPTTGGIEPMPNTMQRLPADQSNISITPWNGVVDRIGSNGVAGHSPSQPMPNTMQPMGRMGQSGAAEPLTAQTVLSALNAGARPRATGRGYGYRK
jgi:hypothetical protein